jgi:DNA-binding sugar fermentation-stimulating protein
MAAPHSNQLVGIHPLVTQQSAFHLLHHISEEATWATEVKVYDARIDYVGYLPNGKKIYVEVKTAMVKQGRNAIFPCGFRKRKTDSSSPRAVKHAQTLMHLCTEDDTESCHLLFVIPRDDCLALVLNPEDPLYRAAVQEATEYGVEVHAFALQYTAEGDVSFLKKMDVRI